MTDNADSPNKGRNGSQISAALPRWNASLTEVLAPGERPPLARCLVKEEVASVLARGALLGGSVGVGPKPGRLRPSLQFAISRLRRLQEPTARSAPALLATEALDSETLQITLEQFGHTIVALAALDGDMMRRLAEAMLDE